ncbi:hypothetical protein B9Z55_022728 [Caenorhabditis nigoni]|uniref:Chromo domain-containing protein n=1 Tax=Caenorhabditis nigoni TaxID=1611254 RepID=A0A2G5SM86_9PELO|nr:hypothetical protein B9Z55_022728 [Caenorhabditis nigoni]
MSSSSPSSSSSEPRRSKRARKPTVRFTGFSSGSTAFVKSHQMTDVPYGFPIFEIVTPDGKTHVGDDAELREYRHVIEEYRRQQDPFVNWKAGYCKIRNILDEKVINGKSFQLVQWKGFLHPIWNTWIPKSEVKDVKDVCKPRQPSKKRPKMSNQRPQMPSAAPSARLSNFPIWQVTYSPSPPSGSQVFGSSARVSHGQSSQSSGWVTFSPIGLSSSAAPISGLARGHSNGSSSSTLQPSGLTVGYSNAQFPSSGGSSPAWTSPGLATTSSIGPSVPSTPLSGLAATAPMGPPTPAARSAGLSSGVSNGPSSSAMRTFAFVPRGVSNGSSSSTVQPSGLTAGFSNAPFPSSEGSSPAVTSPGLDATSSIGSSGLSTPFSGLVGGISNGPSSPAAPLSGVSTRVPNGSFSSALPTDTGLSNPPSPSGVPTSNVLFATPSSGGSTPAATSSVGPFWPAALSSDLDTGLSNASSPSGGPAPTAPFATNAAGSPSAPNSTGTLSSSSAGSTATSNDGSSPFGSSIPAEYVYPIGSFQGQQQQEASLADLLQSLLDQEAPPMPSSQGMFGATAHFAGAPPMPSGQGLFGAASFAGVPPMSSGQGVHSAADHAGALPTPSSQGIFGSAPSVGVPPMPNGQGVHETAPFAEAPPMASAQGLFGAAPFAGDPQMPNGQGFFGGFLFAGVPSMASGQGMFGADAFAGAPSMTIGQGLFGGNLQGGAPQMPSGHGFFEFSEYYPVAAPQESFVTFPDSDDEDEDDEPMPEEPNDHGPTIAELTDEQAEYYPSTTYSIVTFPDEEETEKELDTSRCSDTELAVVPWPLEPTRLIGDREIPRPGQFLNKFVNIMFRFRRYVNQNPNTAPFVPNLGIQLEMFRILCLANLLQNLTEADLAQLILNGIPLVMPPQPQGPQQ